jgi:DNA-binding HxlR family transcriptional regulator
MSKKYNQPCNIACTLEIIGERWTLLIIRELFRGNRKFNELKQALEGIAPNILSDRLQLLESEGVIASTLYSQHPPRYEYALTDKGRELRHVLYAISIWGNRHLKRKYSRIVHAECGHDVEVTYHCPHCETATTAVRYERLNDVHHP